MSIRELWSESEASEELTSAIVAAFAYVAAADGEAHPDELDRFRELLAESPSGADARDRMIASYGDLVASFQDDFDAAAAMAREAIAATPANGRELVLGAARAAVVADSRIDDREEVVVREISQLLDLEPDDG